MDAVLCPKCFYRIVDITKPCAHCGCSVEEINAAIKRREEEAVQKQQEEAKRQAEEQKRKEEEQKRQEKEKKKQEKEQKAKEPELIEEGKKKLRVDNSCSKSIERWRIFFSIIAAIALIIGFFTTVGALADMGHSWYDPSTLVAGLTLLACSIAFSITSVVLKGLFTITEVSEYKKAIIKSEYIIEQ